MRHLTSFAALFLFAVQASLATASITFSTSVTPGAVVGNQQSFSIDLAMKGTADVVSSYGFTATLSTASGPALNLATVSGFTITSPDIGNGAGWGTEFTHNINSSVATGNSITFTGIPGSTPTFDGSAGRFRQINFTANISATQNILVTMTSAATGFVNGGTAVSVSNFDAPLAAGSITAVPEPTSMALLAFGGGFALISRLRSRRTEKKNSNAKS